MYLLNFLITIVLEKSSLERMFSRKVLCNEKKSAINHRTTVEIKQNNVQNNKHSMNSTDSEPATI